MNTKYNFKKPIISAKGEIQEGTNLGEFLSTLLMTSSAKGITSSKYFIWGLELVKSGVLELDDVDKKLLSNFIEDCDNLTVLGRNRLLEVFQNPEVSTSDTIISEGCPEQTCPPNQIWSDIVCKCVDDIGGKLSEQN